MSRAGKRPTEMLEEAAAPTAAEEPAAAEPAPEEPAVKRAGHEKSLGPGWGGPSHLRTCASRRPMWVEANCERVSSDALRSLERAARRPNCGADGEEASVSVTGTGNVASAPQREPSVGVVAAERLRPCRAAGAARAGASPAEQPAVSAAVAIPAIEADPATPTPVGGVRREGRCSFLEPSALTVRDLEKQSASASESGSRLSASGGGSMSSMPSGSSDLLLRRLAEGTRWARVETLLLGAELSHGLRRGEAPARRANAPLASSSSESELKLRCMSIAALDWDACCPAGSCCDAGGAGPAPGRFERR